MRTVKERVARGIEWLDKQHNLGSWRNKVDPEKFQFANPDKGPLGQIFGDYMSGLFKLRIIGGGSDFGFSSAWRRLGDPAQLKEEWKRQLTTDSMWKRITKDLLVRYVKGIRYTIVKENDSEFRVEELRGGHLKIYPGRFCSYNSSKRFVRKLTSKT